MNFKIPSTQTEDMYIKSVDQTVEDYSARLREVNHKDLDLPNRNFDTAHDPSAGEYTLSDKTYAHLLDDLLNKTSGPIPEALRDNVLHFYSGPNAQIPANKDPKVRQRLQDELDKLKAQTASAPNETAQF